MAADPDALVRAVRDDDPLDVINAGGPGWISEAFYRKAFAATPETPQGMWVVELNGTAVGYAHAVGLPVADGHRGFGYVFVQPEYRNRGLAGLLWQQVLSVCTPERVTGVMLTVDADDIASREIALSHGLTLGQLHLLSELDLTSLEADYPSPREDGIVIRPLADGLAEEDWQAFGVVFSRLLLDTPDTSSGAEPMPYAVMRAQLAEPWQVMGAWDGDTMAGFTSLFVGDRGAGRLETMMTGVERPYRGRGLATAMKTAHAVTMRDLGWRAIATLNVETNLPILASNRALGFHRIAAEQEVVYDHPSGITAQGSTRP